jgi:hypothetical protein
MVKARQPEAQGSAKENWLGGNDGETHLLLDSGHATRGRYTRPEDAASIERINSPNGTPKSRASA